MIEEFKNMIGCTIIRVKGTVGDEEMVLHASCGSVFRFRYEQDCCATCTINDIAGDLTDLCGSPIVQAELVTSNEDKPVGADSFTWSFYKFRTLKGDVTVRWLGESNGYYSETVTFSETIRQIPDAKTKSQHLKEDPFEGGQ